MGIVGSIDEFFQLSQAVGFGQGKNKFRFYVRLPGLSARHLQVLHQLFPVPYIGEEAAQDHMLNAQPSDCEEVSCKTENSLLSSHYFKMNEFQRRGLPKEECLLLWGNSPARAILAIAKGQATSILINLY